MSGTTKFKKKKSADPEIEKKTYKQTFRLDLDLWFFTVGF